MFDGTLKFDTKINSSSFFSELEALGNLAKAGFSALTSLGREAVATGQEFSAGMSQIGATLGYSTAQINDSASEAYKNMQALTEKAEEMGAKTSFSASQAAEGLNILAMSGYSAEESIQMIDSVLDMAAAGGLNLGSAASYISGSMKGFTKEAGNFADNAEAAVYYSDLIAKGATLANTNVQQLGEALSDVSSTANTYGQSAQATEVALLRLAEQNEVGSAASTALAAAMKNMYSPTEQAKQALDSLGVSAYDANGKARDFNAIVDELKTALYQITDEGQRNDLENVIFGIQGQAAFDKMVATSADKVQSFYNSLEYTESGAKGSATLQAETMLDNLTGDITIFNSALDGLKIQLFKSLDAPLRQIVQKATDSLSKLTDGLKNGNLPETVREIADDALSFLKQKFDEKLPELLEAGKELLEKIKSGIAEKLPELAETLKEVPSRIRNTISEHLPQLLETGKEILSFIFKSFPENLKFYADTAVQIISALSGWILENLPLLLNTAGEILTYLFDNILTGENISAVVQTAVQILSALVDAVSENIDDILLAAETIITNLLGELGKSDNLDKIVEAGMLLLNKLIEGLGKIGGSVMGFFLSLYNDMMTAIEQIDWMSLGGKIVLGIMRGLASGLRDLAANSPLAQLWESGMKTITGTDFSIADWADYLENEYAAKYEASVQDASAMLAQYQAEAVRIPTAYDYISKAAAAVQVSPDISSAQVSYHPANQMNQNQTSSQPIEATIHTTVEMDGQVFGTAVKQVTIDENAISGGW